MDAIEMYSKLIIAPLEAEVKKTKKKLRKKFSINRKLNKKHLEIMENLLSHHYKRFALFMEKELEEENKKN